MTPIEIYVAAISGWKSTADYNERVMQAVRFSLCVPGRDTSIVQGAFDLTRESVDLVACRARLAATAAEGKPALLMRRITEAIIERSSVDLYRRFKAVARAAITTGGE